MTQTEALVGPSPPGGILNRNAKNNQSLSHQTDVERSPAGGGGIIFLSYGEIPAVPQTQRPFLRPVPSICKCYSADLNEACICAAACKNIGTATPLIYCQPLIGRTRPRLGFGQSGLCAVRPPEPEAKSMNPCQILLSGTSRLSPAVQSIVMAKTFGTFKT